MTAPAIVPRLVIARPGGSPVAVNVSGCLPAVASAPTPSDTFAPARLAWLPGLIRPTRLVLKTLRSVLPGLATPGTVPPLVYCQNVQARQPAGSGGFANP